MSSMDEMVLQLYECIANKRKQEGKSITATAAVPTQDDPRAAQEASAALKEFLGKAATLTTATAPTGQPTKDEMVARTKALEQFIGTTINHAPAAMTVATAPSAQASAPASQAAHGAAGGNGAPAAHGGTPAPTVAPAVATAAVPAAAAPVSSRPPQMCAKCNGDVDTAQALVAEAQAAYREAQAATAAALAEAKAAASGVATQATATAAAPGAVVTAGAGSSAGAPVAVQSAGNFQWKRHVATVETALRNKEIAVSEALLKVLNDVADVINVEPEIRIRLVTQLANIRLERGEYDEVQRTLTQVLQQLESGEDKKTVSAAYCLDTLAQCYQMQEKFEQAEKLRRAAVVIAEETLGGEHPDTGYFRERQEELRQLRSIAMIGQDDKTVLDKLMDEYNAAVAAGQPTEPPAVAPGDNVSGFMFDKYIANAKNALAQKNLREAEVALRTAVEKAETMPDNDERKVEGFRLMGSVLDLQTKSQEAVQFYERALTLAFKYKGWNDIQVAHSLRALADLHKKLSDLGLAKNYYKQAIGTYTFALGKDHETVAELQTVYQEFLDHLKEERKWKGWSA
jgi:tetratricopeptide (TPR) repeat protein